MQEGLKELEILLDPYDWFYEVVAEERRYVVYVTYMDSSQDLVIPDKTHGKQVVVHFASSRTANAKDYFVNNKLIKPIYDGPSFKTIDGALAYLSGHDADEEYDDDVEVPNLDALCRELDRLEKQCGSNILQDIFYETHDGSNAVTNLRDRYPEVKTSMQRLYHEYGFDAIYNELDG